MTEYFAVFDAVAERYVDPFPSLNCGVAIRGFEQACKVQDSFREHPEDYSLWMVGRFDNELGLMEGCTPVKIAMATSFVQKGVAELPPSAHELTDAEVNGLYEGKPIERGV